MLIIKIIRTIHQRQEQLAKAQWQESDRYQLSLALHCRSLYTWINSIINVINTIKIINFTNTINITKVTNTIKINPPKQLFLVQKHYFQPLFSILSSI